MTFGQQHQPFTYNFLVFRVNVVLFTCIGNGAKTIISSSSGSNPWSIKS
jgi:hypothetical protein